MLYGEAKPAGAKFQVTGFEVSAKNKLSVIS